MGGIREDVKVEKIVCLPRTKTKEPAVSLEEELKKAMGYTEGVKNCSNCKHYEEEDGTVDREWIDTCNYNSICSLTVKTTSTCERWEPK